MLIALFFFFNDTPTSEIYTLSLHDALPICPFQTHELRAASNDDAVCKQMFELLKCQQCDVRSEEHTSELQSHSDLVCRLLLEKKKPIHHLRPENHPRDKHKNIYRLILASLS